MRQIHIFFKISNARQCLFPCFVRVVNPCCVNLKLFQANPTDISCKISEQFQVHTTWVHNSMLCFFTFSFFGRIEGTKNSFWIQLHIILHFKIYYCCFIILLFFRKKLNQDMKCSSEDCESNVFPF